MAEFRPAVAELVDADSIGFYAEEEAVLAGWIQSWRGGLDVSFLRPLLGCELGECRASCCAFGANVFESTAQRIRVVLAEYRDWFEDHGLDLDPDDVFVQGAHSTTHDGHRLTRTSVRVGVDRKGATRRNAEEFDRRACVFMLEDGRCSLQALSMEVADDPWYFKPPNCWMYPIMVVIDDDQSYLTMNDSGATDEQPLAPGLTPPPCARAHLFGKPAFEALASELNRMGAIAKRPDFRRELSEATANRPWTGPKEQPAARVGRNTPCPCGSGRKFKVCHG